MKNLFVTIGSAMILAGLDTCLAFADPAFNRIAWWPVISNLPAGSNPATETLAEIIDSVTPEPDEG